MSTRSQPKSTTTPHPQRSGYGRINVNLRDDKYNRPIAGAKITLSEQKDNNWVKIDEKTTLEGGNADFKVSAGTGKKYQVGYCNALGMGAESEDTIDVECDSCHKVDLQVPLSLDHTLRICGNQSNLPAPCADIVAGQSAVLEVSAQETAGYLDLRLSSDQGSFASLQSSSDNGTRIFRVPLSTSGMFGPYQINMTLKHSDGSSVSSTLDGIARRETVNVEAKNLTTLTRTETAFTEDVSFWTNIRNSTDALSFTNFNAYMNFLFCGGEGNPNRTHVREEFEHLQKQRFLPFTDSDAYRIVKVATEAFVMVNCAVQSDDENGLFNQQRDNAYLNRRDLPVPGKDLGNIFKTDYLKPFNDKDGILPYLAVIRSKLPDIPIKLNGLENVGRIRRDDGQMENCFGMLQEKLTNPCLLELIWSYWHEEGMLVQSVNAITRRFQNMRSGANDPLANLEMDPLRPLNNLIWGYIQDEQHRLTVTRRNYEYDHHYGLRLDGKAVQPIRPADSRSKFLEAFHHLLRLCTVFYKQDDDTTVKADAFPVLNALKEVHLILSQGAHNQYGDLPSTSRIEMMMQQWLLARPEFREFLPTRLMVAYPEPWMDRVDAMKKLQGWTDTSVLHFRNLGQFGEQVLLSVRWGHWSDEFEPVKALNWARFFRPQIQGYIHAYRAVTGVDLSADPVINASVDATLPAVLLRKRLSAQQRSAADA